MTRVPQPHLTAPRGRFFILCPLRATFHGTATCWASSCAPLQAWSHFHLTAILILGHRRAALAAHPHSSRPGVLVSSSLPGPGPARGAPSGQHLGLQLWPGLRCSWRRLAPVRVSHAPVALGCLIPVAHQLQSNALHRSQSWRNCIASSYVNCLIINIKPRYSPHHGRQDQLHQMPC